jgi:5'-deoxynucleotidase YfbR-like HD superfamily hydrolase
MVKATKATQKRLENWSEAKFVRAATLLEHTVKSAERFEKTGDPCTIISAFYADDCLYVKADESDKPPFRGLSCRFPRLIETALTHGLNEVRILDVNKLVKAMLAECQETQRETV